jgi:hypothetical protein
VENLAVEPVGRARNLLVLAAALHTVMCLLLLGLTCRWVSGRSCCLSIIVFINRYL